MDRDHSIDVYRGIAIAGMVFFTLTLRLSSNLPEFLRHNMWGSIHIGDFILPMFLFASGLSLSYYINQKELSSKNQYIYSIFFRLIKLVSVGICLSFFSAYGFLEMDEVMLSAILFILCLALSKFNWKTNLGLIFIIFISYVVLVQLDMINIFYGHYLGGYPAALYYLPVMLVGLQVGKATIKENILCPSNKTIMWTIFLLFLISMIFIALDKMTVTPSFIYLSILCCFIFFVFVRLLLTKYVSLKTFAYMGQNPLRFWIMMYVFFLIPMWFYNEIFSLSNPLIMHWVLSAIVSAFILLLLYMLSRLYEHISYVIMK